MTIYVLAFLIGVVAGLRTMTAAAAVSWAAHLGGIDLTGSWLAFLGSIWAVIVLTLLALGELITDQLPSTPSRTVPVQFGGRLLIGAVAGAAFGTPSGQWLAGAVLGIVGAVVGTLGGSRFRGWLAARLKADRPAALIEDAVAIVAALVIVVAS
jgi:uncharacterized membrane protein